MEIDNNQTMKCALESAYVLGNHRQEALAAVLAHDGHHILGTVPKGSADSAKALSIGLNDLAADDVLYVELSFPNRREGGARQLEVLSDQGSRRFSRGKPGEANEETFLHAPTGH
jgi:hypothetical protein